MFMFADIVYPKMWYSGKPNNLSTYVMDKEHLKIYEDSMRMYIYNRLSVDQISSF